MSNDPMSQIAAILAQSDREIRQSRSAARAAKIAAAPRKVVEGTTFAERTQEPRRGNIVLIKGKRSPFVVLKYEWKRGALVIPRDEYRPGAKYGDWVKLERITHLALKVGR